MLIAPPIRHIGDTTVFADDRSATTFYVASDRPRVRRDEHGAPAISLALYRYDDATRARGGAIGAGNLRVDVDLSPSGADRAAIIAALQTTTPITLLEPPWTRCDAEISFTSAGATTKLSAHASALAGSFVRLDLDLTEDAASLLASLFEGEGATGLRVVLDVACFARLPPVAVTLEADPKAIYDLLRGASDSNAGAGCTASELDAIEARGLSASALYDTGAIRSSIDRGDQSLDASASAALVKVALARFEAMARARFFEMTHTTSDPEPRFQLVSRAAAISKPLSLTLSSADVIEWSLAPQTSDLTEDISAADRASRVVRVALGDPFWETLAVAVTVFADFDAEPIAFVEVDIQYDGGDSSRAPFETTLTFDRAGAMKRIVEPPALIDGARTYRYRTKIAYTGRDARVVSSWTLTDRFDLDVAVADPGKLRVDVLAGDVDFALVRSISALVEYEEDGATAQHTLALSASARSASHVRFLVSPPPRPPRITPTFYLADGRTLAGDPVDATSQLTVISLPSSSTLRVALLLSGDLHDVSQALVTLSYDDGDASVSSDFRLASLDDMRRWTVVLREPEKRTFRWSAEVDYHHKAPDVRDEVVADGSQTIAIEVAAPPSLRVDIHPELVDFTAVPLVTVDLAHDGSSPARASLPITSSAVVKWETPLVSGEAASFTYAVTYHPKDRDPVALPPVPSTARAVVIPALLPPKTNVLKVRVLGVAIDFATVDQVSIDVHPDGDAAAVATAVLTAASPNATLTMPVQGTTLPSYVYRLAYTPKGGGSPVVMPEAVTSVPLLVPPPLSIQH